MRSKLPSMTVGRGACANAAGDHPALPHRRRHGSAQEGVTHGRNQQQKPDRVRQKSRHDEQQAGDDHRIAVEHGLERQPPVAHRSEHAPDHRRPAHADDGEAEGGRCNQKADRRPETNRFPCFDKQGDLGERQGDENEQRR